MVRNSSLPISMRQVTKKYGQVFALDHVDLDIRSGEFLTLLGPSGSGKTTLLTVLAGFTRPDHGSLKFGDAEMIATPPHKRGVGMVFQNYALFPHMNVADNVAFALRLRGLSRSESAGRVEKALDMVRLGGYGARGIDQLSGGQRQRVALARAMVFEPRIMLMDEPLSALDKQLREHMQIELRQLHDKLGMTTVYVTHDQREALTMSDRIAVVNGGRVMQLDTPRAIYERPAFVPVRVVQGQVRLGQCTLSATEHPGADGARLLMLRPERLQLLAAGQPQPEGLNLFGGQLVTQVYQGDSALLQVALDDGTTVWLRHATHGAGSAAPEPGAAVRVGLSPQDTVLLPAEGSAA
jgi:putative spermidine/putrescine transport system ATP-binding protein